MSDSGSPPPPSDEPAEEQGPPGATPPPPSQRPLLRRDHDKHLAGVAGGLADYFGVDAGLVRVGFVILAFLGAGIPLYIVGWVAMPSQSMRRSHIEQWFGASPNPAAIVAIAIGLLVLFAVGGRHDNDGFGWGLAFVFAGWLLFRADSRAAAPAGPASTVTDPGTLPPESSAWRGPGGRGITAPFIWPPAPPREARPPSVLGRLTIGVALASVGVAWLLAQAGVIALEPAQYVALALTITGFGLVVGAWVGRAYGLIAFGFVLTPVMLAMSVLPFPLPAGVGEFAYEPNSVEELRPEYSVGLGQIVLDLTQLDLSGETATTAVTVGAGEVRMVIPDDVTVYADVEMRAGEINLFDMKHVGRPFGAAVTDVAEGAAGGGRLDLIVDGGLGKVTIETIPALPDEES